MLTVYCSLVCLVGGVVVGLTLTLAFNVDTRAAFAAGALYGRFCRQRRKENTCQQPQTCKPHDGDAGVIRLTPLRREADGSVEDYR